MVNVPGALTARVSVAQASADGLGSMDGASDSGATEAGATVAGASVAATDGAAADGDAPPPEQAAARAATRARAMTPRVVRMIRCLLLWVRAEVY